MIDGARAVQKGVLEPFPEADLGILVVWIAMMDTDTLQSAREAAEKFTDRRVQQFFDSGRLTGKAIAASLGHDGEVAWDFYLFYPAGSEWRQLPPSPSAYMHQLPGKWPDPARLFEKKKLKKKLASTMKSLFT